MRNKIDRKKYLINRAFQLKYLTLIVSVLLLHTLMVLAAVFGPTVYSLYSDVPLAQKTEAARSILLLHQTIWPWILAVIGFFGAASIFITHKMAGPLFRIISDLKEIESGNYSTRINLRRGDELVELAYQINILADKFNTSRDAVIQRQAVVTGAIAELKLECNSATPDRHLTIKLVENIERETAEISSILNHDALAKCHSRSDSERESSLQPIEIMDPR